MFFLISMVMLLINGMMSLICIDFCLTIALITVVIVLRAGLLFGRHDFLFNQFNLYRMIFKNFLDEFGINFRIIIEFLLPYGRTLNVVDSLEIKSNTSLENGVICNVFNLNFNTLIALQDRNHIKIHSLADDYSRNAIVKSFENVQHLYDDHLF